MIKYITENNQNVKQIPVECIIDATLLSREEANSLLTRDERAINKWWWLKTPGKRYCVCTVDEDGDIGSFTSVSENDVGVRPVLIIDTLQAGLDIGDRFMLNNNSFKVISTSYALCENIITTCAFQPDWKYDDSNDYEKSAVKKIFRILA